ncbi:MAG: agmatinase [Magnetococcales bacterium]|nr:agmatinase [Magnetococcales bacterium]
MSFAPFAGVDSVSLQQAQVVVMPVPYGATLCYGTGAARGPEAIVAASMQMEWFDEELLWDLSAVAIHTTEPLEVDLSGPEAMIRAIQHRAQQYGAHGGWLIALGGEHSITTGLVRARQSMSPEPFSLLQIDAHADLRDSYQGTPWSHACVMRRIFDLAIPCVRVGIRSLSHEEWQFVDQQRLHDSFFWAHQIVPASREGRYDWIDRVVEQLLPSVYITIDLDGLDPSVVPAVGTPEPGGLDYYTLLRLLRQVFRSRHVVGCDITELSPIAGQPASDFLAAKLVHKLMGYQYFGVVPVDLYERNGP